ncbi:hypothetical protein ALP26_102174 [Pseudomonas savastanoi pv. glycinea]|nr:hypothetical protein AC519_3717 [Pseudomonas savastanoi]KPB40509.1 Uncharacterized protein AC514_4736 [Pseudomonas savastanoi pv. phaseolicola]KPB86719.1 Uncharacterized protein AC504_3821 [Pseudomonas syringae pv. maculicola]KPC54935.1 Uncharacterized protein ABK00_1425 [Pseudomonas savastanoi pv. glycinea]KPW74225.1 hypothetical protein ALO78_101414 [Pseudomonas amygdali pv. ciccaronei]KPW96177.1 hypothetical protein ALO79_100331 [Pseudomonas syringae pv. castaneae]KPX19419.1 hypothetica
MQKGMRRFLLLLCVTFTKTCHERFQRFSRELAKVFLKSG